MPAWSVPVISLCSPIIVILAYSLTLGCSRVEAHNAVLGSLTCVITAALITNLIKLGVRTQSC